MDWNDLRHFLALARTGSVRAAGASLGVSHSTVARRVDALEERLAARLFDRHRDGFTLTDAGRQMLPGAERVEREMAALERGVVGQDERLVGPVALTCCDTFISGLLLHALAPFCAEHPQIELKFTADSRPFDLSRREADLAIRTKAIGADPPGGLIGQRLAPVTIATYVARAHAARLDPDAPGSDSRWVSFEQREVHEAMAADTHYAHLPAWGAFASLELLAQAARAGLGIAMLPTYVGDRDASLRRLSHPDLRHLADLWLLCHPDLRDNSRIRATRRAMAAAFQGHRTLFTGEGWTADALACPEITPH
ncbi:MAG: DNA-binding transcriptional LysR family regulator [Myxococcota bacterium]|jgi:DNA-binding transcriptional LysR family regulator